jgi:Na+-transporting methylmalonyl-CoA/oxaloacetate decarboxylase gamma subunit
MVIIISIAVLIIYIYVCLVVSKLMKEFAKTEIDKK